MTHLQVNLNISPDIMVDKVLDLTKPGMVGYSTTQQSVFDIYKNG